MPRVATSARGRRIVLPARTALRRNRPARPRRAAATCRCELLPGRAVRLSPRIVPRHRAQPRADDRARHQQLPGGGEGASWTVIDPGPVERAAPAGAAGRRGRGRRPHRAHPRHPHPPRPFAGRRGAGRGHRRAGVGPRRGAPRVAGRRASRPTREPQHGERLPLGPGTTLRVDPHARPRVQPPVLPARGGAACCSPATT